MVVVVKMVVVVVVVVVVVMVVVVEGWASLCDTHSLSPPLSHRRHSLP